MMDKALPLITKILCLKRNAFLAIFTAYKLSFHPQDEQ